MPKYQLSKDADKDLENIADYTIEHFGIRQARQYRNNLNKHFDLLAENPLLYPSVDHIRKGYRRSVCGAHSIFYRVVNDGVEIMTIIRSQNIQKKLPKN